MLEKPMVNLDYPHETLNQDADFNGLHFILNGSDLLN